MSMFGNHNSATFDVAIVTVCVDPETTEAIIQALEGTRWAVTAANFDAYISSLRRPYFGPQIGAAKSVIAVVDYDADPDQAVESTKYLQTMFAGKVTVMALAESRDPDLLLSAMRGGCTEFLHKPFQPEDLNHTLTRLEQHLD